MSDRPGDFDYYALVLSWSPSFCLSGNGSHADDPQCGTQRPYAFVVHGLWPQYDKGWPEDCASGDAAVLPPDLARSMLDIMPSEKLVTHEFGKHGTCSGLDAQHYFGTIRSLFGSLKIPPKYVNLAGKLEVPLGELRHDLLAANPQFSPDGIAVNCEKNGRLAEVHFCFSRQGQPQPCGRNEVQAKMCRQDVVSLPPVRGLPAGGTSATAAAAGAPGQDAAGEQNGDGTQAPDAANDNQPYSRHRHHHHHHKSYFDFGNNSGN